MKPDLPEELTRFHRATMWRLFGIFATLLGLQGVESWLGESAAEWTTPVYVGIIVFFVAYVLYRALMARPSCPACGRKMREAETVFIEGGSWRIVECPECGKRCRIPGLS